MPDAGSPGVPDLLHVDDALIVVHKPSGLLAVQGRVEPDCLAARMQVIYPDALVVHRLDQATSGLMVFARGKANERALSKQFQARNVTKRYEALVAGHLDTVEGHIDLPLGADWPRRPRQQLDAVHGKASLTLWQLLEYRQVDDTTRLALTPVTGRTHQLRVHLQAIGHPIVGDTLYGGRAAHRLMLHACHLGLQHPVTLQALQWDCPAPF